MTPDDQNRILRALQERNAFHACPRCANLNFTLVQGYFAQIIQNRATGGPPMLNGPYIPSVIVTCNQCGFMSQHALSVLGLVATGG